MLPLILLGAGLLAVFLYNRLRYHRFQQYASLPQRPPSLLWGNMKEVQEWATNGEPDRHPDLGFKWMGERLGSPPVWLLDIRPFAPFATAVIQNHEVADQIAKGSKTFPYSTPRTSNEEWKALRKRFNPGFAPQHLLTLLPTILDKSFRFLENLDQYARSGEIVRMDKLTTALTFDIIGAVTMDIDLDAQQLDQSRRSDFMNLYSEMLASFTNDPGRLPWWMTPRRNLRRRAIGRAIDRQLEAMIRSKSTTLRHAEQGDRVQRSVFDLCVQGTESSDLPADVVTSTRDNVKTFLFAGHDTLSTLLLWIFYELSRTPRVLKAVRAELDDIFGPDPDPEVVRAQLAAPKGGNLIRRMTYASAVIKECLRLYPPASAMRGVPKGSNFSVRTPQGQELCLDGLAVYINHYAIQRDPGVYGPTANDFVPERWLGDTETSNAKTEDGGIGESEKKTTAAAAAVPNGNEHRKFPAAAWRPFERGPRDCIGQELANVEARVIMALVARRYDFVKTGLGELDLDEKGLPVLNDKNQYKVKQDVYCTIQITSRPKDSTMRVKMASTV
ncbi:cytochrome P450 [Cryphonectria parasitica EP155]|uniref:Cytochrome P450 n=1 Tax=Cryphonectria parasitica (strain ATCC 38755 / EP155) TaxID=660469 RepID=A0A9P4XSG1_CRYP1|nr:cytochrome P450 [Cryphonectria parasitica EP155]KAF3759926.1 cytochrome P450 [Cryphonectria parasitica EP155]